jgi:endonuclease/exonuclease/phosphatase family metal-dependent hydrolase
VTSHTVVATANVLRSLRARQAREALEGILELSPDLVGLQEWGLKRFRLLRELGSVGPVPGVGARLGSGPYLWNSPMAQGCAIGARADRYDLLSCKPYLLSRPGHADKPDRFLRIEPPRIATHAVYRDKHTDRVVSFVNFHLVPGVQAKGRYRPDRPKLVSRHQHEVARLQALVDVELAKGRVVYAVGDANFDGVRLAGLTSAWDGREGDPGTFGPRRKIDDVLGPGRPTSVTLLVNPSDHKAVVASRPDVGT